MIWLLLALGISVYMSIGYALGGKNKKVFDEWQDKMGRINPFYKYLFFPYNAFHNRRLLQNISGEGDIGIAELDEAENCAVFALIWPLKFILQVPITNLLGWSWRGIKAIPKAPIASFAKYCLYYPFIYAPYLLLTSPARVLKVPSVIKRYLEKRKERKALKVNEETRKRLASRDAEANKDDYYTLRQSIAKLEEELTEKRRLLAQKENQLAQEEMETVSPNSRDASLIVVSK